MKMIIKITIRRESKLPTDNTSIIVIPGTVPANAAPLFFKTHFNTTIIMASNKSNIPSITRFYWLTLILQIRVNYLANTKALCNTFKTLTRACDLNRLMAIQWRCVIKIWTAKSKPVFGPSTANSFIINSSQSIISRNNSISVSYGK